MTARARLLGRLQFHALGYNLGNFLRTLASPSRSRIGRQSLTSLKDKLIKTGARSSSSKMAEVAIHGKCSGRFGGSSGTAVAAITSAGVI
jgi:hypothetical protein